MRMKAENLMKNQRRKPCLENGKLHLLDPKNLQRKDQKRNQDVSTIILQATFCVILTYVNVTGGPRVEVEYEQEMESVPLTKEMLASW